MEFSIKDIVALFMKRMKLIAICTILGFCSMFFFTKYFIKPSYTASVQLYVTPDETESGVNLNELTYAQKVVTTYINFLQTKVFYKQVIETCKLNYTASQLQAMTRIQTVNNTEIFQISVTTHDPNDSFQLVQAMQYIAPELIKGIKSTAVINVVDPVVLPTSPSSPNAVLNTMIGGMAGFVFAVFVSLIWEIIDVNVGTEEELSERYNMPILGSIPNFDIYKKKKYLVQIIIKKFKKNKKILRIENNMNEESKFLTSEAFIDLRTNLRYTLHSAECKKIIVCSPTPKDGKSTTSINLSISIAQSGAKVLLMDCDLRKGRLHNYFMLPREPGMSDVLCCMYEVKNVIQKTNYEKLDVLTMGSLPPNPTDLLSGAWMEDLIKKLEKEYDYIIMDTPPVTVVSDSLSLAKLVDGILLVVREDVTTYPNIAKAVTRFKFIQANILGFVINGVSIHKGKRSKSQYYYYH